MSCACTSESATAGSTAILELERPVEGAGSAREMEAEDTE